MTEEKCWITFWTVVAVLMVALIAGLTTNSINQDNRIADTIAKGNDPVKVGCAFHPNAEACKLFVVRQGE